MSTDPSESTPLLVESPAPPSVDEAQKVLDHEAVYRRFTESRKRFILALVSLTGLLPLFTSGTFVPSIPQIAHDLGSTGPIINLAVSLSVFTSSLGTMCFATYSGYYGRRPVYLFGLPMFIISSMGVGSAQTVPQLLSWRVTQAFGVSGGLSVGAAAIADLYKLEQRGTAMGIFFAAVLLGPALAPPVGGFAAHYSSWRTMQYALGIAGIVIFLLILVYFPETSHPGSRGVDKDAATGSRRRFVFLNPVASLALLRSPNLLAVCISGTTALLTDFVLLIPLAYTIGARYNISNEFLIGACFLPAGVGNFIGAPLAGRISDILIVRWKKRRNGEWVPEDRLRATLIPALTLVPLSVLFSGLITRYVEGRLGLVLNLLCLFMNGLGVDLVLSPFAAYSVDIVHHRSAECMAATAGLRNGILSFVIAGILPSINTFGVAKTNAFTAFVAWLGAGLIWCTIRYGDRMRAWIDVGYSTALNN